ncbi:MAG: hypothetical protein R6W79_01925 [Acidimicrobiia bacterium]
MAPALRHTCWAIRRTTTHGTRRRPRIQARQEASVLRTAPERVLVEPREGIRADPRYIRTNRFGFIEEPQAIGWPLSVGAAIFGAGEAAATEIGVRGMEGVLNGVVLPAIDLEADRRCDAIEPFGKGRDRTPARRRPTTQEEGLLRHDAQRRGGSPEERPEAQT